MRVLPAALLSQFVGSQRVTCQHRDPFPVRPGASRAGALSFHAVTSPPVATAHRPTSLLCLAPAQASAFPFPLQTHMRACAVVPQLVVRMNATLWRRPLIRS